MVKSKTLNLSQKIRGKKTQNHDAESKTLKEEH